MLNIPDHRVESALASIAESDLQIAHWKGQMLRSEFMAKAAEAVAAKTPVIVAYKGFDAHMQCRGCARKPICWPKIGRRWNEHAHLKAFRKGEGGT